MGDFTFHNSWWQECLKGTDRYSVWHRHSKTVIIASAACRTATSESVLTGVAALQAAWIVCVSCSHGVAMGYICSRPLGWGANYFRLVQFKPKSVIRVYGRLAFVSSRLASSLAKVRKASSECLSATSRQGCGQDAERNADMA